MQQAANNLIAELVEDLEPVRTLKLRNGLSIAVVLTMIATLVVAMSLGVREDLAQGKASEMFFIRSGVLLLLGMASAFAAIHMARPGIGKSNRGWIWALATAALFPVTALIMGMINNPPMEVLRPMDGLKCFFTSVSAALVIGSGLTLWLRQGAPTSPERAGWLVGIASGALGAAAHNIHCPFNDIYSIGLWYTVAVAVSAIVGRLVVPHFIRW